jgi:hypothetical protein
MLSIVRLMKRPALNAGMTTLIIRDSIYPVSTFARVAEAAEPYARSYELSILAIAPAWQRRQNDGI